MMPTLPHTSTRIPFPILCIGHSHIVSVAQAAAALGVPFKALNFWEMPGAIALENGVPRLSPQLERQLREHLGPVFSMIGGAAHGVLGMLVHQLCAGRMCHIESPPPYADAERMHADMPWGMYPGMCHEISPAVFRYKLWRLHSQIIGKWCNETGTIFVPCPAETLDENGFMREPYYGDGAHANATYGELILEQMRGLV
jgi:hypothetical protein